MYLAADAITRGLMSVTFWAGLVLGCFVGSAFTLMKIAWLTHKKAKEGLPGLKKLKWLSVGNFLKFAVATFVLVVISLAWISGHHLKLPAANPSPAPSVSRSHR